MYQYADQGSADGFSEASDNTRTKADMRPLPSVGGAKAGGDFIAYGKNPARCSV